MNQQRDIIADPDGPKPWVDLIGLGLIEPIDLIHACNLSRESGDPIDQVLCKLGMIEEASLAQFLSTKFSLPRWRATDEFEESAEIVQNLNLYFCQARRILPLRHDGDTVVAAIVDPSDKVGAEGLRFCFQKPIKLSVITSTEFDRLLDRRLKNETDDSNDQGQDVHTNDVHRLKDLASTEPIVRLVNNLIAQATRRGASDIHLEPARRSYVVRFRIDGLLTLFETITYTKGQAAVSRLKILSRLDIAERRRPQDGRFTFPVEGRSIDLRISSTPTVNGESIVLRLLDASNTKLGLESLGLSDQSTQKLEALSNSRNGILLVTGPTGSGKTTTLYSLIEKNKHSRRKILTIEDPIEYHLNGVNQTQVNPAIGLTFAAGLRSFLRHDPDMIMVGEMRDIETARTAIQASLTGHIVLSTLHTNSAAAAIVRLIDMGIEDYLIASSVIGVAAQRLVRATCTTCKGLSKHSPNACQECNGEGFKGRTAICEVLEIDLAIQRTIKEGVTVEEIEQSAKANGFRTIREDAEAKIQAGLTSLAEVDHALGPPR